MCVNELLKSIEDYRNKMVNLASHTSLSDHQVIEVSTKLDQLLNKYYTITSKK